MEHPESEFARVVEEQIWRVYGFISYRVASRETVEDLTQLTFERALRAWPRYDSRKGSESTWLLAIARNLVIDHHRADRSDRQTLLDEELLPPVAGPEMSGLFTGPELIEAVGKLSEREREMIALKFGGDLTGPEIAAMTGLSLANVQQILSRSLRKLRDLLDEKPIVY